MQKREVQTDLQQIRLCRNMIGRNYSRSSQNLWTNFLLFWLGHLIYDVAGNYPAFYTNRKEVRK